MSDFEIKVPFVLQPYSDLVGIYKAIVASPLEDTPRMMFIDAAQDCDAQPVRDWGRFVALQYERQALGQPRTQVTAHPLVKRGGPDYFVFDADEDAPFKIGDRIDVLNNGINLDPFYHGLKVMRISPSGWDGAVTVSVKQDAESLPFLKEKAAELDKEIKDLFLGHWPGWFDCVAYSDSRAITTPTSALDFPAVDTFGYTARWIFRRGFPDLCRCSGWHTWIDAGGNADFDDLDKHPGNQLPLTAVILNHRPTVRFDDHWSANKVRCSVADSAVRVPRPDWDARIKTKPPLDAAFELTAEYFWPKIKTWVIPT